MGQLNVEALVCLCIYIFHHGLCNSICFDNYAVPLMHMDIVSLRNREFHITFSCILTRSATSPKKGGVPCSVGWGVGLGPNPPTSRPYQEMTDIDFNGS